LVEGVEVVLVALPVPLRLLHLQAPQVVLVGQALVAEVVLPAQEASPCEGMLLVLI
jgi:hypothetical protein